MQSHPIPKPKPPITQPTIIPVGFMLMLWCVYYYLCTCVCIIVERLQIKELCDVGQCVYLSIMVCMCKCDLLMWDACWECICVKKSLWRTKVKEMWNFYNSMKMWWKLLFWCFGESWDHLWRCGFGVVCIECTK